MAEGGSDRHNYLSVDVDLENGTRRSPDGREFRECDVEISATTQENGEQVENYLDLPNSQIT